MLLANLYPDLAKHYNRNKKVILEPKFSQEFFQKNLKVSGLIWESMRQRGKTGTKTERIGRSAFRFTALQLSRPERNTGTISSLLQEQNLATFASKEIPHGI